MSKELLGSLELNRIYHMDCLEGMKLIPDKSINMILCDLPYGTTQCSWDIVLPFKELWKQYNRIIKNNGIIALFGSEPFSSKLRMSNIKYYKYDWIWEKSKATNFLNAKRQPLRAYENICIFYKNQPIYNPQMLEGKSYNKGVRKQQTEDDVYGKFDQVEVKSNGLRYPRNVIYFKTAESEGETYHKTQKPVSLCEYLIKTYTNENDIVLDNCIGSGTTAIAATLTNRKWIGFETESKYIEIANKRLKQINLESNLDTSK